MPLNDATLSQPSFAAAVLFFADFADLPIRGAMGPCPIHVPTGLADADADCAGFTFETVDTEVLSIGAVSQEEGGTDTFTFTLRADPNNPELMTAIGNPALYVGRTVRVWFTIVDFGAAPVGGGMPVTEIQAVYRGYMTQPAEEADSDTLIITMQAENWRSVLSGPQSRTYLESTLYDAGDLAGAVMKGQGRAPGITPGGGRAPMPGLEDFTRPR